MRHDFVVTLRREQSRRTELAGFCLLLFSFLAFLFTSIRIRFDPFYLVIATVVMIAGLLINAMAVRRRKPAQFSYWLFAAAIGWALMPYARWILSIFVLFAIWETRAAVPLTIRFSTDEVMMTSFPHRHIPWTELQSVVLKDGLLTLDFKNNRLVQREVSGEPDEAAFNLFVHQQLEGQKDGRR